MSLEHSVEDLLKTIENLKMTKDCDDKVLTEEAQLQARLVQMEKEIVALQEDSKETKLERRELYKKLEEASIGMDAIAALLMRIDTDWRFIAETFRHVSRELSPYFPT